MTGIAKSVLAVAVVSLLNACGGSAESDDIGNAVDACGVTVNKYAIVGDEGRSLQLDSPGADQEFGVSTAQVACVLSALDVPDSVLARMEATRALDGMQQAEWEDFNATWTYHPDDGLDVIVEVSRSKADS